MALMTVDVVLELPEALREQALALSSVLVERMRQRGGSSHFQLGQRFPGATGEGVCEPHVSLFMLLVADSELGEVDEAVRAVAGATPPLAADGERYRHNPQGAPELYFRKTPQWSALQRAVVAAVEPLRRGRLRDTDPAGERLPDVIERLRREEQRDARPGGGQPRDARLRQLETYGYDEIADERDDRFNPHVTLAWPVGPDPVDLTGLPDPEKFSGVLTGLATYRMNAAGTCTVRYHGSELSGVALAA